MNMTIDEEIKLWEDRSNDEFGKILKSIIKLTDDYFVRELGDDGFGTTPVEPYSVNYAVYGDRSYIFNCVKNVLENYDILGNDDGIDSLMVELENLI